MRRLLPPECGMYVTRLPVLPGELQARLDAYVPHYAAAAKSFGALKLDALYIGLTGSTYALGEAKDRALCASLSADAGVPVVTASVAIVDTLRTLAVDTIAIVSPYPPWLTARARGYLESAGLRVGQVVTMTDEFRAYHQVPQEVIATLKKVNASAVGAIVIAGTALRTLDAIATVAAEYDVPLLSSNLCGAWRVLERLGGRPGADLSRAAPSLAARLPG
jgi:maleate isomerase